MQDFAEVIKFPENQKPRKKSWQVPVFVIGCLIFLVAIWFRFSKPATLSEALSKKLSSAIELTSKNDFKPAESQLREVLGASNQLPEISSRTRFHLARLLLEKPDILEKPDSLLEPTKFLESFDPSYLNEKELKEYTIVRAKLDILGNKNISIAIDALEKALATLEDSTEALEWIARGALKLPEPDLPRALKANEEYRNIPLLPEEKRVPAQLLGGEILMRLQRHEEARKVLENIHSDTRPELELRAKVLLAESYEKEKHWLEAVQVWKQILETPADILADMGKPLYHLALCLAKIELPREAEQYWKECEIKSQSDEKNAASMQLALLYLDQKSLTNLANQLGVISRNLASSKDWKNSYFTLENLQELFVKAEKFALNEEDFDIALKINESSQRVLTSYSSLSNRSVILNCMGKKWASDAKNISDPIKIKGLNSRAEKSFKDAASLRMKAAAEADTPANKSEQLWLAAGEFQLSKDSAKSMEALVQFINHSGQDSRVGQAWYLLGDAQRELGKPEAAKESYLQAMKHRGPYAYRSRYQIALLMMEKNEFDQAADILEQNLQLLRFDPDQESQERSLFALGSLFFQRKNYRMVVRRYEEALEKYGQNQQAIRARLQLGESYRQLANQEQQNLILNEKTTSETKTHYQNEHRKWLNKASETYQELEQVADSPIGLTQLSEEERKLIPLLAAECKFNLGNYESALIIYTRQFQKTKGSKESLHALGGMIRCHSVLGQQELVQNRLVELRSQLSNMDEGTKKEWEPWLAVASKPIQKP